MYQWQRLGRRAQPCAGSFAGKYQAILGVIPEHAGIIPDLEPQYIVASVASFAEKIGPILGPLLIDMAASALSWNRSRKQHFIGGTTQGLNELSRF